MKLIHASDIHLDSPMRGLAMHDGAPIEELHGATRRALANLVDTAIEEQADVVLLAGDLFDGDWPHYGTGVQFVKEMGRLREAGIAVVSIAGNHDAQSKLTKGLRLPENVHVLSVDKADSKVFEGIGLAVHGQGYAEPAVMDDLSLGYPKPRSDLVNVGLLHTCATGRAGHANYAPCKVSSLQDHGYEYWALGHVHGYEVLSEDPPVLFSGNLQGRGIHESGPKGAVLIEIGPDAISFERRIVDAVRWEVIELNGDACSTVDDVCNRARTEMKQALEKADGRLLAARVAITGTSDAHHQLLADPERLRHEMLAAAVDVAGDRLWIEDVRINTTPSGAQPASGSDAVGELLAELEEIGGDDALVAELASELTPVFEVLPTSVSEEMDLKDPTVIRAIVSELSASLPAELLRSDAS